MTNYKKDVFILQENKKYYKNNFDCIRLIKKIENNKVYYECVNGALSKIPERRHNSCSIKAFQKWAGGEFIGDKYPISGECVKFKIWLILSVSGEKLLKCSDKRAKYYIKKDLVKIIDAYTLQFIDDSKEKRLKELFGEGLSDFF